MDKRRRGVAPPRNYDNAACAAAAAKLEVIAAREGIGANHLILAYLMALAPNIRPIIGPHDAAQVRDSYAAGTITLSPDAIREIATATGQQHYRG